MNKPASSRKRAETPLWLPPLLWIFYSALAVGLGGLISQLWPLAVETSTSITLHLPFLPNSATLSREQGRLLVVLVAGALGTWPVAVGVFLYYAGNGRLSGRWVWWHFLTPFKGAIVALIFYTVVRANFLTVNAPASAGGDGGAGAADADKVNGFGVTAIAFLSGMFAPMILQRLESLTRGLLNMQDRTNPRPVLTSLSPSPLPQNSTRLEVVGRDSVSGARVLWGTEERDAEFESTSRLRVTLEAADTAEAKTISVRVRNPAPGGGESEPVDLVIAAPAADPAPAPDPAPPGENAPQ